MTNCNYLILRGEKQAAALIFFFNMDIS